MRRLGRFAGAAGLLWLLPALFGASTVVGAPSAPRELVGTFAITAGTCSGAVHGSHFRMMTAGGASYIQNGDSPCADKTFSPLLPGSDGGLRTGAYQPAPSSRFDGTGGGTANRITRPTPFFGVAFATSTESVDPQTNTAVPPPSITADDAGKLTGATAAFGAAWNNEDFNQGAPKPDGSRPGSTSGPSGTYDAATGAFTLEWTSLIVGGPFNGFTGVWHLEGTFSAEGAAPATTPAEPADPGTPPAPSGAASAGAQPDTVGEAPAADTPAAAVPPVTATPAVDADEPAAPGDDATLAADTAAPARVSREGWLPATWLVVLTATLGVGAVVVLLYLSRTDVRASS